MTKNWSTVPVWAGAVFHRRAAGIGASGRGIGMVLATVLGAAALFTASGALAPASAPAYSAGSGSATCDKSLPAATDGHFVVDRSSVRAGDSAIGVLSGFQHWPQALVGAGSGEVFESCTPWETGNDQVMAHDASALFLIPVPAGTGAGTYEVSVVFYQGSTGEMDWTNEVRLTTSITVGDTSTESSVCQLEHATATAGALQVPDAVHPGGQLPVTLAGATTWYLNEYDRLYFVACLAGYATPVTYPGTPGVRSSSEFTVPVPAGLAPGTYELRVTGVVVDSAIVWWTHNVVVQEPQPSKSPTPTTQPVRTVGPTQTVQSTQQPVAATGTNPWLPAAVGVGLVLAGAAVLGTVRWRRMTH